MKTAKRILIWIISLGLIFDAIVFMFLPLPNQIPILMYHFLYPRADIQGGSSSLNVSIEEFEKQMHFLKTFGYRTLSLDEYYEIKSGSRKPRGKEILITFDDGHRSYLEHALPILERYQLKSVNFVVWQHLTGNEEAYIHLDEAKEILKNPLVDLQSHTLTHPNLQTIPESQAREEIVESKKLLEKAFGKEINYFCYPEGSFSPDLISIVKEAGYRLAFRTSLKFYHNYPDTPYSLVRWKIGPKYNLLYFWFYASGSAFYVKEIDHFFHHLTLSFTNGKLNAHKLLPATT